jgi:hypothetical protein
MFKHKLLIPGLTCFASIFSTGSALTGAERPTFNHHTRDPRPNILPNPWENHVEYRRAYNRPTYLGGWLAHKVSRTSQEALVWEENVEAGNYDRWHMPPMYKRYFAPKPWEVLKTGPRPDFPEPRETAAQPGARPKPIAPAMEDLEDAARQEAEVIELSSSRTHRRAR